MCWFHKMASTEIYILSLHDALPILISGMYVDNQKNMYEGFKRMNAFIDAGTFDEEMLMAAFTRVKSFKPETIIDRKSPERRSEEHTSELQSRGHLVCRLLLEKKKLESIPDLYIIVLDVSII